MHALFLVQVQASSYLSPIPAHTSLSPSSIPDCRLRAEMEHERSAMHDEAVQLRSALRDFPISLASPPLSLTVGCMLGWSMRGARYAFRRCNYVKHCLDFSTMLCFPPHPRL